MKWRVLWHRSDSSIGLRVFDDLVQAVDAHDERQASGEMVWIEDAQGRSVPRQQLGRTRDARPLVLS